MEMNNIIMFEILNLEKQKILNFDEAYLELFETYFRYVAKYESEDINESDEKLPSVYNKVNLDIYILKTAVSGIEKSFREKMGKWQIYISVLGRADDIWIFYEDIKECEITFDRLIKYFFNGIKD